VAKEITLREHLASIASKGGKARAEKLSVKRKQAIAKKAAKAGGNARAAALTPAKRKEIAQKAAAKRWAKTDKNQ
jgi:general stress protein YciG